MTMGFYREEEGKSTPSEGAVALTGVPAGVTAWDGGGLKRGQVAAYATSAAMTHPDAMARPRL